LCIPIALHSKSAERGDRMRAWDSIVVRYGTEICKLEV
jgi:hypothetical protein